MTLPRRKIAWKDFLNQHELRQSSNHWHSIREVRGKSQWESIVIQVSFAVCIYEHHFFLFFPERSKRGNSDLYKYNLDPDSDEEVQRPKEEARSSSVSSKEEVLWIFSKHFAKLSYVWLFQVWEEEGTEAGPGVSASADSDGGPAGGQGGQEQEGQGRGG